MFWKISYIVDTGYFTTYMTSKVSADSKEKALEILHSNLKKEPTLQGSLLLIKKVVQLPCDDNIILYNTYK